MHPQLALCCLALSILPGIGVAQESSARASAASSCERVRSEDVITSVSARGELALTSGRAIKLLDIRLPDEEDDLNRPLAWLRSLAGRRVAIATIAGGGDRWGREAGDVALLDESAPIDIAGLLVAEGFAIVDAGDRSVLCRPELLARSGARGRAASASGGATATGRSPRTTSHACRG